LTYALLGWRGILPHSITALTFLDLYLAGNPYLKRKIDVESYYKPPFISDLSSGRLGDYRINARFNIGLALPRNSGMINSLELGACRWVRTPRLKVLLRLLQEFNKQGGRV
jgi:hypothetical protein